VGAEGDLGDEGHVRDLEGGPADVEHACADGVDDGLDGVELGGGRGAAVEAGCERGGQVAEEVEERELEEPDEEQPEQLERGALADAGVERVRGDAGQRGRDCVCDLACEQHEPARARGQPLDLVQLEQQLEELDPRHHVVQHVPHRKARSRQRRDQVQFLIGIGFLN